MGGSVIPGPALLSVFAHLTGWVALLGALYVWYRLGWIPALAYLTIPFVVAQIFETSELFLFRVRTTVMALVCTPIGIVGFVMLVWALIAL